MFSRGSHGQMLIQFYNHFLNRSWTGLEGYIYWVDCLKGINEGYTPFT